MMDKVINEALIPQCSIAMHEVRTKTALQIMQSQFEKESFMSLHRVAYVVKDSYRKKTGGSH